jgi:hypothetical protein
MTPQHHR